MSLYFKMASVEIAIEKLLENEVEEISRDGQEKYAPQLSMSEKLAKLAQKIDFLSDVTGHEGDEEKADEDKTLVTFQPSLWPWDSVREKLRKSLTEVCVLSDVLNVVREKKYIVLDPVSQNQATPKQTLSFLTKKKSLANAAGILLSGAQRMEDAVKERADHLSKSGELVKDFHSELMMLRRKWRLKRTGTSIMGDLTYRSAGSQFRNPGLFEVTKATKTEDATEPSTSKDGAMEVSIASDLEGAAQISVAIVESGEQVDLATVSGLRSIFHENKPTVVPLWQKKLESAQSNLFSKELFLQLSQEAYNTKENTPHFVMANEIRAEIFPGTELCVTYSCREENSKENCEQPSPKGATSASGSLEYALHSLLRRRHHQAQSPPTPRPVTCYPTQGGSKRVCLAGASAHTAAEVAPSLQSEDLLETVLNISRHQVLQRRAVEVVDRLSAQLLDPCITCHWSSVGNNTSSLATVHISSPEVGDLARASFQLRVGVRGIHVVDVNGLSLDLSTHAQDLEDFILSQVCNHRLSLAQSLAKSLGWHVIHCSRHVGTGPMELRGHAAGLMVKSPNSSRAVAVRTSPSSGVSVLVKRPQTPPGVEPELLGNMNWGSLGGDFNEVHWSKMLGRTFAQKVLLLLAAEMV